MCKRTKNIVLFEQTCNLFNVKYSSPPDSCLNFWNSYKFACRSSVTMNKCSCEVLIQGEFRLNGMGEDIVRNVNNKFPLDHSESYIKRIYLCSSLVQSFPAKHVLFHKYFG